MVKAANDKLVPAAIMDVMYNHTGATENSVFNQTVQGYNYRHNEDGASQRIRLRQRNPHQNAPWFANSSSSQFKYWTATEYKVDGFAST